MFTEQELKKINERFFSGLFLQNNKLNAPNNLRKLRIFEKRLDHRINKNMNVLDVGAGEAWTMDYCFAKKCNYFAIEAIPRLANSIKNRGGIVLGDNLEQNLKKYESFFDIIIFRHALEHLLDSKQALKTLKGLLKKKVYLFGFTQCRTALKEHCH